MAAEGTPASITTRSTTPLVAIFADEDGQELVRYIAEDAAAPSITDAETRAALAAIGSCSDLDWDAWASELDRLRHESPPTPPIDLLGHLT